MCIENHVMLELTCLQLVHALQFLFWHIVSVHVHQNVLDHNNAHLDLLPSLVHLFKKILITAAEEFINERVQLIDSGVLNSGIEQVSVLV